METFSAMFFCVFIFFSRGASTVVGFYFAFGTRTTPLDVFATPLSLFILSPFAAIRPNDQPHFETMRGTLMDFFFSHCTCIYPLAAHPKVWSCLATQSPLGSQPKKFNPQFVSRGCLIAISSSNFSLYLFFFFILFFL